MQRKFVTCAGGVDPHPQPLSHRRERGKCGARRGKAEVKRRKAEMQRKFVTCASAARGGF